MQPRLRFQLPKYGKIMEKEALMAHTFDHESKIP